MKYFLVAMLFAGSALAQNAFITPDKRGNPPAATDLLAPDGTTVSNVDLAAAYRACLGHVQGGAPAVASVAPKVWQWDATAIVNGCPKVEVEILRRKQAQDAALKATADGQTISNVAGKL